ncbi:MAG: hypothetical protein DRJ61_14885 [Acidobacteria bacterium]|nr:MAG: hypothetical protein DRJ65_07610 [Acidobacteriota bacterium]RLE29290.1 MAG: hypothetical protein DRJ61_14885 [Acidobacteriota bacterium]
MRFDPNRPVESFKAQLRDLLKGYEFDVKGLILNDGSIEPLPREASVVGKVLEISIKHLSPAKTPSGRSGRSDRSKKSD